MEKTPRCIAFILDGNRRWAQEKGLPKMLGHKAGFEKLEACVRWVAARGIPHMAVYAFSTENWNRDKEEVGYLMDLYREIVKQKADSFAEASIALRFIGKLDMLPEDLRESMQKIHEQNPVNPRCTVWVCISYGARAEIAAAASEAARAGEEINEMSLRKYFWSAEMPDPDIVVRSGGEQRLSNFLLWQAAYSELFFLKPFWPDFSEKNLDEVLEEFAERERRIGT